MTTYCLPVPQNLWVHSKQSYVLYDPKEKLPLAGDAFMGVYFAAPNPDVDSRLWLEALDRLLRLEIEILVDGHGHVYTRRADIPEIPGVVIRQYPMDALREKKQYLSWLRDRVEAGVTEGLPIRAVEATCFPWGKGKGWEGFWNDEMMRVLSLEHCSRTELLRTFFRDQAGDSVFPTIHEARLHCDNRPR